MIESGRVWSDLPEIDRRDDPRGGSVAWAVLAVTAATLVAGVLVSMIWVW